MERFFGLHNSTLVQMRQDLFELLGDTIKENAQYPKDQGLVDRVTRLTKEIDAITNELWNRNDV